MTRAQELACAKYTPAAIECDFGAMHKRLDRMLEAYGGLTAEVAANMPVGDAKICRKDLKAMSNDLNEARRAIKRKYNEPLAAFEAEVKKLDARILEPWAILDAAVKGAEDAERAARMARLEEAYEDFAPALVELVPFERIAESKWANKTYGEGKAEAELLEKVTAVAKDWEALRKVELKCPAEAEAEFFRTLSLRRALDFDKIHAEEQRKIEELNCQLMQNSQNCASNPPEEPPAAAEKTDEGPVRVYVLALEASEEKRQAVVELLQELGVPGRIRVTGFTTTAEAMRAWERGSHE